MRKHDVDVAAMQETKTLQAAEERRKGYILLSSTSATQGREKCGVGWRYKETLEPYRVQFTLHSSTLAEIEFNMQGNRLVLMTAHIPHDQVAEETRAQSWDSLEHRTLDIPEAKNLIIVGDFNPALHTRKQGEEDVLGPNIYGKGAEHLQRIEDRMADETRNNRMYLLDYLRTTGAIHANTFFEKPWDKKLTWKPPATQGFAPPWNPERFAELDICVVRDRWKNAITNVQSDIRTNIDSDHIALHVNIRKTEVKETERRSARQFAKGY